MCTSPNTIAWLGKYTTKRSVTFQAYKDEKNPILPSDYETHIHFGEDLRPKFDFIGKVPYEQLKVANYPYIQVPCGQCLDCRIQQARTWADRIVLEAKQYKHNYFVTLTYDQNHIPPNGSLVPDDMSLFMRRIRKRFKGVKIRFFGCGEYGDISRRCHLHLILFNCPLTDLSYDFLEAYNHEYDEKGCLKNVRFHQHLMPNNSGNLRYSAIIHRSWDYKGNISVGAVTYDSAAYVSQYVTKKHKPGMKQYYEDLGIEPEFVRMSTHPGIAYQYYEDNDDFLLYMDKIIIPSKGGAHEAFPCRYFDKLFIKKYGESVFNHGIRSGRISRRFDKFARYIREGINPDFGNHVKDYKLKKKQLIRKSI